MRRNNFMAAAALVILAVLFNLPVPASLILKNGAQNTAAPFENGLIFLIRAMRTLGQNIVSSASAARRERAMQAEIAELRLRLYRAVDVERENRELRDLLGLPLRTAWQTVPCQVVARGDVSGWWRTLTLNRGAADGIKEGMPVVAPNGLVGRTCEVSRHSCKVLLITDPTCRVAAKIRRTHANCIVRGLGVEQADVPLEMLAPMPACRMDYVPIEQRPVVNDEVVTSGLGGLYPEGIPIGTTTSVSHDKSGLYCVGRVIPAADLAGIKHVLVLKAHEAEREK